jgi:pimeloyl-ACP methyl ester carboxylesterase
MGGISGIPVMSRPAPGRGQHQDEASTRARLLRVTGASHYPQVEYPDVVNAALREAFSMAG